MSDTLLTLAGTGQRAATFRFDLLDQQNSYLGRLDVDMGSVPTIANNINRDVKRQMDGLRLPPSVTADVNTLRDRVRPWMVLQDGREFPLGVFLFADASRRLQAYGSNVFASPGDGYVTEASMLDQLCTVNQGSRGINFYGPGHSVYAALVQQMEAAGIWDYEVEASDATIAQWVVWKPNTKRLTVINDLAAMGGYYSLYFDNLGVARMRQVPSLESVEPSHSFDAGGHVYAGTVVESDDLLDAPNVYVVVNSSFTDAPIWGEWAVPSSAPHSYSNRGFWVVKEIDQQGVESNAAAAKAAKTAGQADYATYRWLDLDAAPDPTHDTFDIAGWKGDKFREQGWTLHCMEGAAMHHELRRVWSEDVAELLLEAA